MALFMLVSAPQRRVQSRRLRTQPAARAQPAPGQRPFGEPRSSEEPLSVEHHRAREPGRGRSATHPLQIPWAGWKDILWRSYAGMNANRLLAIAGGVAFFVLLAIFPPSPRWSLPTTCSSTPPPSPTICR